MSVIEGTYSLARFLVDLKEKGTFQSSGVAKQDCEAIQNLLDLQYIVMKKSGGGYNYSPVNQSSLDKWAFRLFPDGPKSVIGTKLNRAEAAKKMRNSKKSSETSPFFEMRFHELSRNRGFGYAVETTSTFGSVKHYYLHSALELTGSVVLIENLRTFLKSESLFPQCDYAIRYDGRPSDKLLSYLESTQLEVIVAPDYDPVGIDSFLSVRDRLLGKVELYVPENLEDLFSRSNRSIMEKPRNKQTLRRLLKTDLDPQCQRIIKLIQRHLAGLEQETLHF